MNDWDRDNLMFLMRATPAVLKDWLEQADEDDIAYANELLAMYSSELDERGTAMDIDDTLSNTKVYPEAQAVLARFRL